MPDNTNMGKEMDVFSVLHNNGNTNDIPTKKATVKRTVGLLGIREILIYLL